MPDPQNTDPKNTEPSNLDKLDGQSLDITAQRLAAIKAVLPEAFDLDGNLVRDKLLEALKPASYKASDDIPSFGLAWPGKQSAFAAAGVPTTATLRPCPEQSVDFDTTQNLLIEGDNLEVLKTLQRSYHGKVKMIYIDPPYNTGKDFVYPDNYGEGLDTYLQRTEQKDDDGFWKSTNSETSGRKHANWLSMMAPRLTLARNLLRDDGVIFISIDDNEFANLRQLCDEIFGAHNFVGTFKWNKTSKAPTLSPKVRTKYEYVICYEKLDIISMRGPDSYNKMAPLFNSGNNHARIKFTAGSVTFGFDDKVCKAGDYGKGEKLVELHDDIEVVDGTNANDFSMTARFKWSQDTMDSRLSEGQRVAFKTDKLSTMYYCLDFEQGEKFIAPSDLFSKDECGVLRNDEGWAELQSLFGGLTVFDYVKPVSLPAYLARMSATDHDIVLDFFAGSGTTGQAVMTQNVEDGCNCRYICVQLPEPLDEPVTLDDGVVCETIFDLTRERLKRAGKKIKEEAGLNAEKLDTGLRVFKLDSSNFTAWNGDPTTSEADLLERLEQLNDQTVTGRSETDILWEILLKMGLPLDVQLEYFELEGASFIGVADRTKVISTQESIPTAALEALLNQDIPPSELVVLDSAFEDDSARANIATLYRERKDEDGKPVCNLRVV